MSKESVDRLREKAQNETTCSALSDLLYLANNRIEELERQLAAKETLINEQNKLNKERQEWALHTSEIIRNLNRQLAEREKDAERYRWLRDPCNQRHEDDICVLDSSFNTYFGQDLDCAINTALQSQKGGV